VLRLSRNETEQASERYQLYAGAKNIYQKTHASIVAQLLNTDLDLAAYC
jgi:hypothetical protein